MATRLGGATAAQWAALDPAGRRALIRTRTGRDPATVDVSFSNGAFVFLEKGSPTPPRGTEVTQPRAIQEVLAESARLTAINDIKSLESEKETVLATAREALRTGADTVAFEQQIDALNARIIGIQGGVTRGPRGEVVPTAPGAQEQAFRKVVAVRGAKVEGGFNLVTALQAGVRERDLRLAGFPAKDVQKAETEFQVQAAKQQALASVTRIEGVKQGNGFDLALALEKGVTERTLRLAGFSTEDIRGAREAIKPKRQPAGDSASPQPKQKRPTRSAGRPVLTRPSTPSSIKSDADPKKQRALALLFDFQLATLNPAGTEWSIEFPQFVGISPFLESLYRDAGVSQTTINEVRASNSTNKRRLDDYRDKLSALVRLGEAGLAEPTGPSDWTIRFPASGRVSDHFRQLYIDAGVSPAAITDFERSSRRQQIDREAYRIKFMALATLNRRGLAQPVGKVGSDDWELTYPASGVISPELRQLYRNAGLSDIAVTRASNQILDARRGVIEQEVPALDQTAMTPRQIQVVKAVTPYITPDGLQAMKAVAAGVDPQLLIDYGVSQRSVNAIVSLRDAGLLENDGGVSLERAREGGRGFERRDPIARRVLLNAGFSKAQIDAAEDANRRRFGGLIGTTTSDAPAVPTAEPRPVAEIRQFEQDVSDEARRSFNLTPFVAATAAAARVPGSSPQVKVGLMGLVVLAAAAAALSAKPELRDEIRDYIGGLRGTTVAPSTRVERIDASPPGIPAQSPPEATQRPRPAPSPSREFGRLPPDFTPTRIDPSPPGFAKTDDPLLTKVIQVSHVAVAGQNNFAISLADSGTREDVGKALTAASPSQVEEFQKITTEVQLPDAVARDLDEILRKAAEGPRTAQSGLTARQRRHLRDLDASARRRRQVAEASTALVVSQGFSPEQSNDPQIIKAAVGTAIAAVDKVTDVPRAPRTETAPPGQGGASDRPDPKTDVRDAGTEQLADAVTPNRVIPVAPPARPSRKVFAVPAKVNLAKTPAARAAAQTKAGLSSPTPARRSAAGALPAMVTAAQARALNLPESRVSGATTPVINVRPDSGTQTATVAAVESSPTTRLATPTATATKAVTPPASATRTSTKTATKTGAKTGTSVTTGASTTTSTRTTTKVPPVPFLWPEGSKVRLLPGEYPLIVTWPQGEFAITLNLLTGAHDFTPRFTDGTTPEEGLRVLRTSPNFLRRRTIKVGFMDVVVGSRSLKFRRTRRAKRGDKLRSRVFAGRGL